MASEYQKVRFASNNGASEICVTNQLNCQNAFAYLAETGVTVEYPDRLYSEYTFTAKEFNKLFKVASIDF